MNIRKTMMTNAQAYNRHLTTEYMRRLPHRQLLRLCHPNDRIEFARRLRDIGRLDELAYNQIKYEQRGKASAPERAD